MFLHILCVVLSACFIITVAFERQEIAELKLVYLHIAKSGGTSLNSYIPVVLGIQTSDTCNKKFRIPRWTLPLFSSPDVELQSLRGGKFGKDCHFLTMEWPRGNMEPALARLGYQPHTYQVLSSFREPLSHFMSALSHINGVKFRKDQKAKENNQPYTEGKISLQDMVKINKNGNWYEYNLENFQSRFMYPPGFDELSAARIDEAINYMHKLYWFSVISAGASHTCFSVGLFSVGRPSSLTGTSQT
jgi:hypothetical protein